MTKKGIYVGEVVMPSGAGVHDNRGPANVDLVACSQPLSPRRVATLCSSSACPLGALYARSAGDDAACAHVAAIEAAPAGEVAAQARRPRDLTPRPYLEATANAG
jgi:hypothetical protein